MPKLNLISFGSMSFYDVKTAHFMSTFENVLSKIDLPELKTFTTGFEAFYSVTNLTLDSIFFLLS